MDEREKYILSTSSTWVQTFIVGLQVCPFAKKSVLNDQLRYYYTNLDQEDKLLRKCWEVLEEMLKPSKDSYISNCLLVIDTAISFDALLDFMEVLELFLERSALDDRFQVVAFHPTFCFDSAEPEEAGNFVNRSPFPMIHFLRSNEVADVINQHPDIESIPKINKKKMEHLGTKALEEMLRKTKEKS